MNNGGTIKARFCVFACALFLSLQVFGAEPEIQDSLQYLYQDNFFFIGRVDSNLAAGVFGWQRERNWVDGKAELKGKFMGGLGWKDFFFNLEPQDYPIELFEPRTIPPHPAFDFHWPNSAELGEFSYHFERIYVNVYYDSLLPLHVLYDSAGNSSDLFITNAVMQGQNNDINGILLYHRLRLQREPPDKKDREEERIDAEGPGKLFFLNAPGGESFLLWNKYPFEGPGPKNFSMKINWTGDVYTSEMEVDYEISKSDTTYVPRLQLGWNVSAIGIETQFVLESVGYSRRIQSSRFYQVKGRYRSPNSRDVLSGLMIDNRRLVESNVSLTKKKKESEAVTKPKGRPGFSKFSGKKSKKSGGLLGNWKKIRAQQKK